jgi:hypothetical protein
MLKAGRGELETSTRVAMLAVSHRELKFFIKNCNQLATLSALLAGISFDAMLFTKYVSHSRMRDVCDPSEFVCADTTYPICLLCATGFSLFALWGSMLITFLAPNLALRGPDGSLGRAIELVIQEYQYVLFLFTCALVAFFFAVVMWSLTREHVLARWGVSLTACGFLLAIYFTTVRSLRRFEVPSKVESGMFSFSEEEKRQILRPLARPRPRSEIEAEGVPWEIDPDAPNTAPNRRSPGEWTGSSRRDSLAEEPDGGAGTASRSRHRGSSIFSLVGTGCARGASSSATGRSRPSVGVEGPTASVHDRATDGTDRASSGAADHAAAAAAAAAAATASFRWEYGRDAAVEAPACSSTRARLLRLGLPPPSQTAISSAVAERQRAAADETASLLNNLLPSLSHQRDANCRSISVHHHAAGSVPLL